MPDYKLCLFEEDGAARSVADFSATDDALAVRLSEDATAGHRGELWRGDTLLARFAPETSAPGDVT